MSNDYKWLINCQNILKIEPCLEITNISKPGNQHK